MPPQAAEVRPVGPFIRRHGVMLTLLGLTALGGVLRFYRIGIDPLLGDEARTFMRINGSYRELLPTLQTDGFPPLFYELYWWIGQGMPVGSFRLIPGGVYFTPFMMRLVPAICGTLMVPVMYFLARQLLGKRASLLSAAFASCSAYLVFFSRNAKMYMPVWLFIAMNMACFLWWLRAHSRVSWLAWVASGVLMAGTHVTGLIVLALQPLFLLSVRLDNGGTLANPRPARRIVATLPHWKTAIFFVLGLALIGVGPAGYYLHFNKWTQKSGGLAPGAFSEVSTDAKWERNSLGWIAQVQKDRAGPDLFFHSTTEMLTGYEWPSPRVWKEARAGTSVLIPPRVMQLAVLAVSVLLGIIVIGAFPWRRWRPAEPAGRPDNPWWRGVLWLGIWIIVPTYGVFYCRSMKGFVSPAFWLGSAWDLLEAGWLIVLAGMAATCAGLVRWPRVGRWMAIAMVVAGTATVAVAVYRGPMDWFEHWRAILSHPGLLVPLLALSAAVCWFYSGEIARQRMARLGALAGIVGAILILCWAAWMFWTWSYGRAPKDRNLDWQSIWQTRYVAIVWPALAVAVAALLLRLPSRSLRWFAILALVLPNLANVVARVHPGAEIEVPYDRMIADAWAARDRAGATRVFLNVAQFMTDDATISDRTPGAVYYACLVTRAKPTPEEFRGGSFFRQFRRSADFAEDRRAGSGGYRVRDVAAELRARPNLTEIIVWDGPTRERWDPAGGAGAAGAGDRTLVRLGSQWKLVDEQAFRHRGMSFWSWMENDWYSRRRYVRTP